MQVFWNLIIPAIPIVNSTIFVSPSIVLKTFVLFNFFFKSAAVFLWCWSSFVVGHSSSREIKPGEIYIFFNEFEFSMFT